MLDQSFSVENFRRILDLENRKGVYLEGKYFPKVKEITKQIKSIRIRIGTLTQDRVKNKAELQILNKEINDLKEKKEKQLCFDFQEISKRIVEKNFRIKLAKKDIPGTKTLYIAEDLPSQYFAMKQIQSNVQRLFGVKQNNRFAIVNQLKILLNDTFPKYVLRTDVNEFYESIPHDALLRKINGNNLLSPFSRKLLRQILSEYKELSGQDKGLPRGIGVSPHLSELFMEELDKEIMALKGVTYYARYVDDIVLIFTPTMNTQPANYLDVVREIVESKFKLKLNTDIEKTKTFDLRNSTHVCEMNYLGYKFIFGDPQVKLKTRLTQKKIEKYKNRINLSIEHYLHLSKINEKEARQILVQRLRFLTGNTRLKNSKRNVLVGIYYSNCHLTENEDILSLDDYLRTKINGSITSSQLRARLSKYSFIDGFNLKRFSPFKTHELQKIIKAWK